MHQTKSSLMSLFVPAAAFLYEAAGTNTLLRFASVLALGATMTSCVPAKNYDEARSAAETEFGAHARTRSRLEAAHERIRTLEQALSERERALESGESSMAAAKLESIVLSKDKEAALELVETLRSELARTGNHLVRYSDEKRDLARALMLAEERVRAIEAAEKDLAELVATVSDLSLALGPDVTESGVEIGASGGKIVLGIPAKKLFAEGSDSIVVDAAPVLSAVGKVANEHPRLRVVLSEPEGAALAEQRVARLGAALRDRGVPDARLVLPSRPARAEEPTVAPVATDPASPSATGETPASSPAVALPVPLAKAPIDDAAVRYEIAFSL